MPYPADQREVVALEAHARPAAVAEAPPGQLAGDVVGRHRQPRGQAFDDHDQGATV